MVDVEKGVPGTAQAAVTPQPPTPSPTSSSTDLKAGSAGPKSRLRRGWEKFEYYNGKMEAAMGIEARGIERVPEDERPDKRLWGNLTVWLSANCVLPTFGTGILGPLTFGMHLGDSMLTIFFFAAFAAMLPAFSSTFGPRLGLRQMTSSRYSWGFWGSKGVAFLNCIACIGWSTANTIAGAQTLCAVGDWTFSAAAGTVIIAMLTLALGMLGYKYVHLYEQFAWFPTMVTFFVLLGVSAKHLVNQPMSVGRAEMADVFSFGGIIWGFCIGWVSMASDYNVYMPEDAPSWKVFMWTYLGIAPPCILIMWLGSAVAAAALAGSDPSMVGTATANWYAAYKEHEVGGLLHAVLVPPMNGGGKFFMVLLVLSVVANNIINVYSLGMSISVISKYLQYIPRIVWPCVATAIYIPIAIVGADQFASTLEYFLGILGYWLAIFVTVLIEEHFIFRKGKFANYNAAETWNNRKLLPIGLGAMGAFCCGVAGIVVGMSQVWFSGPIGKKVGGFGGDLGFELASAFTAVSYPVFRYLEIKYMGR